MLLDNFWLINKSDMRGVRLTRYKDKLDYIDR